MIRTEDLTKSFNDQILFEEVNFEINSRERVGLVGRNGYGKTTLFRLIAGDEYLDTGKIIIPRHYRIGYVRQNIEFSEDTVLKEGMRGLIEEDKDHHWKVEKILSGLGFSDHDMDRHPQEFSGGYQVRLNLVKVLVSEPDLLLLDEPTNYLDIISIRWIENFLQNWPRELILITHDRSFMDKVITHTLGIHHKKVRKISGNTEKFYRQIAKDEEIYEKTRVNDEKRRKEIEQFINRFRAKARLANMVQSRIKTLQKMEKLEKLEKIKTLDFSFRSRPFPSKQLCSIRELFFSYDSKFPLIEDLNITIGARDRICVIGKNGKGKTTLLRLLAGALSPQQGEIVYHPSVATGFFEQSNLNTLGLDRTVEEEILYSHFDVNRQLARDICGAMMFGGDHAVKKIGVLSGGERSRVMLGKVLATPVNLLLLDEPTNHLDMESCDSLLAAVDSFDGAVIIVTHNEMFLHALALRLIVFQKDRASIFEGSYQEFLEKVGWEDEEVNTGDNFPRALNSVGEAFSEEKSQIKLTKKELRRRRSEIIVERSKILKPLEQRILEVENRIESHEKEIDKLNGEIIAASQAKDGSKIAKLSRSIHAFQKTIENLFDELEEISNVFDAESTRLERELVQME